MTGPDRSARAGGVNDYRDIVLITVDAWRTDTLDAMSALRELTDGYERSVAISGSASTNGAFPPLLASQHLMRAYNADGSVRSDVTPLPQVLCEAGYVTGGIVASNPFLAKWNPYFDHFWNDGMSTSIDYSQPRYSTFDRAQRFVRLKQRVNATEVARHAKQWYCDQDSPRFLWMHLMDLHGPYFPSISKASDVGLVDTYRTLFNYHIRNEYSKPILEGLWELYHRCVERLDEQLSRVFEFLDDDAVVIVTGDHGEEFHHGYHGHAQLYDECVTTPLFAKNLHHSIGESKVRHIDLAPTILEELEVMIPSGWEGKPVEGTNRRSLLCNHTPMLNRTYLGVRTERYKFIKSYDDETWSVENRELYDLQNDPNEQNPVDDVAMVKNLEADIELYLGREDVDTGVIRERKIGINDAVEERLRELGYV